MAQTPHVVSETAASSRTDKGVTHTDWRLTESWATEGVQNELTLDVNTKPGETSVRVSSKEGAAATVPGTPDIHHQYVARTQANGDFYVSSGILNLDRHILNQRSSISPAPWEASEVYTISRTKGVVEATRWINSWPQPVSPAEAAKGMRIQREALADNHEHLRNELPAFPATVTALLPANLKDTNVDLPDTAQNLPRALAPAQPKR